MQSSAWKWIGLAFVGLSAMACADEGVGDPCLPETIPQKVVGTQTLYGFEASESYIESSSVQCRSRLCIVYQLNNNSNGAIPADPRNVCDEKRVPGCVDAAERNRAVHCTCKCGGPKTAEQCECSDGYSCEEILTLGGEGIRGKYCVKKPAAAAAAK